MLHNQDKEILLILQEECSEVIQAVSKIFRFGLDSEWKGKTNREQLTEELGDLLAMIVLIQENNIASSHDVTQCMFRKKDKLKQWSNIYNDK